MKLCVYCASSDQVDDVYKDAARTTGQFCADKNIDIVYGGGRVGLMGLLADQALEHGGHVTGVIPDFLEDREIAHQGLQKLITTKDMQSRQLKMAELADAFLVLPGGLGTLAEFFEVVTWKQLHLHQKPIYIWNVHGYWDDLIALIHTAKNKNFMRQEPDSLVHVIENLQEIKT